MIYIYRISSKDSAPRIFLAEMRTKPPSFGKHLSSSYSRQQPDARSPVLQRTETRSVDAFSFKTCACCHTSNYSAFLELLSQLLPNIGQANLNLFILRRIFRRNTVYCKHTNFTSQCNTLKIRNWNICSTYKKL